MKDFIQRLSNTLQRFNTDKFVELMATCVCVGAGIAVFAFFIHMLFPDDEKSVEQCKKCNGLTVHKQIKVNRHIHLQCTACNIIKEFD